MSAPGNKVFIIKGRDAAPFEAICELLVALGIEPVTWTQATTATARNNPTFGQILDTAFKISRAVLVLLTPDEDTVLRTELRKPTDAGDHNQTGPIGQSRPNVLYELGYAMSKSRKRTIVLLFNGCRTPSDMYGLHTIEHDAAHLDRMVAELTQALQNADVAMHARTPADLLPRCEKLRNLPPHRGELREYIRAGTTVRSSEFSFRAMLDGRCDDILMTGTNFGDQFGQRGQPVAFLYDLLKQQLLTRPSARITLVFAPPQMLEAWSHKAFVHLRDFSLPRLCDLYDDPEFSAQHRARLRIVAHPGALYFQAVVRDPLDRERALLVATPRWPGDASGAGRFYFAVRRKEHPAMFDTLSAHIPTDLDLGGSVSFEEVAKDLGVVRRAQGGA